MTVSRATVVRPARAVRGALRVPPDKSISHRYALFAALADGPTSIRGYSTGADCQSTLGVLEALGVVVTRVATPDGQDVAIIGRPSGFAAPGGPLDCGNSGTTMRLMAGLLASQPFDSVLIGDQSLSSRPMRRVITPLTAMGARLSA